jgi:succinate dehydrogenase hydrophobic anchor subunit
MSLKSFHIFFIVVSTLTTLAFGLWSIMQYTGTGDSGDLWLGIVSLLAFVALVIYGIRFFKKLKQIGSTPGD